MMARRKALMLVVALSCCLDFSSPASPSSSRSGDGPHGGEVWGRLLERSRLGGDVEAMRELRNDIEDPKRRPYLSFVTILRNDDYGGRLLDRFSSYLSSLAAHSSSTSPVRAELIVVEWDPPAGRGSLRDAVSWPDLLQDVTLLTVPASEIARVGCKGHQYQLQNLGVGFARGDFVFVNNADVIPSGELMMELARGDLDAGCFYRADRVDVLGLHPLPLTSAGALPEHVRKSASSSDASLASHAVRHLTSWGLMWTPLPDAPTPQLEGQGKIASYRQWPEATDRRGTRVQDVDSLHYTAGGDFTGMSRDAWMMVGGFDRNSFCHSRCDNHTDSYILVTASALGLRQVYLKPPAVVYHLEHSRNRQSPNCDASSWPKFLQHSVQALSSPPMAPQPMEAHGPGGREGSWQTGGAVKYSVARWSPLLDALSKDGGLPTGTGAGCDVGGEVGHATEAHHGQSCVGDWTHLKNPWAALSFIALAANKASQMQGYAAAEVCYLASLFAVAHESTSFGAFAAAVRGALTEGGGWEGWSSSAMAQVGASLSVGKHGGLDHGESLHRVLHVLSSASLAAGDSGDRRASRIWAAAAHAVSLGEGRPG